MIVTNLKQQVEQLRARGSIVVYGGAGLAQSLVRDALIDEYHLLVSPVAISKGKALFSDLPEPRKLKAIDAKVYDSGAVLLTYTTK